MMLEELDSVVLAVDLPEYGLSEGDLGTVVSTVCLEKVDGGGEGKCVEGLAKMLPIEYDDIGRLMTACWWGGKT
jgi:hypothetical protein